MKATSIVCMVVALLLVAAVPVSAAEDGYLRPARLAGFDRAATAVEVSRFAQQRCEETGCGDYGRTVVVAREDAYPDALAGAPLAGRLAAPLLLTAPDRLDEAVREEVGRLGTRRAYLLGGRAALSPAVEQGLRDAGVDDVVRLAGTSRYDTAAAVAAALADVGPEPTSAVVVDGDDPDPSRGWPDAVSAAQLAGRLGAPILLTDGGTLPEATRRALQDSAPESAVVVGGEAAVPGAVVEELRSLAGTVERIAGGDRYETSARVAEAALAAGASPDVIWVATGNGYADALAGGGGGRGDRCGRAAR